MERITDPEKAKRLARTIAMDIALYNEQKVKDGIERDTLFEVLKDEIEEGRELYASRVDPGLVEKTNFFDRAVVDVLIKRAAGVKSRIW